MKVMNNINNNINSNQPVISVNKVTHHIFTDDDVDGLECNLAASSKAFFLISRNLLCMTCAGDNLENGFSGIFLFI
jgi:hypothetical protein